MNALTVACVGMWAASQAGLSVAVLPLTPQGDVPPGLTAALTRRLAQEMDTTGVFSRVVDVDAAAAELPAAVDGLQHPCQTRACFAGWMAALQVDMVVAGTVTREGPVLWVRASLMQAPHAQVLGGVAHQVCGGSRELLLGAMASSARRLLVDAQVLEPWRSGPPMPATGTCQSQAYGTSPPKTAQPAAVGRPREPKTTRPQPPLRMLVAGGGGVSLAMAAALGGGAAVLLVTAAVTALVQRQSQVRVPDVEGVAVRDALPTVGAVLAVVGGVMLLPTVALGIVGAVLLAWAAYGDVP